MEEQINSYVFFDQCVRGKMSKKGYEPFQDNVNQLTGKSIQRLTAFGLLEFAGFTKLDIFDMEHKNKKLSKYLFHSYEEICEFIPSLKNRIYTKIPKHSLKRKLERKRDQEELEYLNEQGLKCINRYIEGVESIYEGLIDNLFLDRLSQINISKLSIEDKEKIIHKFIHDVIGVICQKRNMGGFRLICKIFQERKGHIVEGTHSKTIETEILRICRELKPSGDLVDCELIHLAFFGSHDKHCHCYTTDNEETIEKRLILYCKSVDYFIRWYFEYEELNGIYHRPKWRCGEVFILNRDTGEKVKQISATEIYEKVVEINQGLFK